MRPSLVHLLLLALLPVIILSCSDTDGDNGWQKTDPTVNNANRNDESKEPALARLEFPHTKGGSLMLIHYTNDQYGINYSVEWDIEKRAPRWSAYQMHSGTLKRNTTRYYSQNNQYPRDPMLPDSYYFSTDLFWSSGFSHGHICPSADRLYSTEANYQTFFLTNMQPQYSMFNSGVDYSSPWCRLEDKVRTWAASNSTASNGQRVSDTLYVVKGGTIEDNQLLTKIKGELRVPKYFFVALLLKNQQGYKAIGFWIEHDNQNHGSDPLNKYAMNIRELEQLTGIDFFCNLPDDVEARVEQLPRENVCRAWGI